MSAVVTEARNRILYVTLNRPEAKNAINKEVHLALCDAWERLMTDDGIELLSSPERAMHSVRAWI